ncbi:hypothetical protein SAMN05421844_102146 [Bosea robiniae]|uniref:Uncharacterized protein n=1 Tax=Bosea robiniae TaxID=1036780 RepID=A0ABY0NNL5_9HYPH|nr:hypothetical protein SAMN05421844_102146 [Bosea robiniae]
MWQDTKKPATRVAGFTVWGLTLRAAVSINP